MVRKEKGNFAADAIRANLWGWLLIFPTLFCLLWITGQLETRSEAINAVTEAGD